MANKSSKSIPTNVDPNANFKKNIRCLYKFIDNNIDLFGECDGSLFNEFFKKIYAIFDALEIPESEFDQYIYALLKNKSFFEIVSYFLTENFDVELANRDFINKVIKFYEQISNDNEYSNTSDVQNECPEQKLSKMSASEAISMLCDSSVANDYPENFESMLVEGYDSSTLCSLLPKKLKRYTQNEYVIQLFKQLEKNPNDESIINNIFEHYLYRVIIVASSMKKTNKSEIEGCDLFQEGCVALLKAIKNYDYKIESDFSKYINKCIYFQTKTCLYNYNLFPIQISRNKISNIEDFIEMIDLFVATNNKVPSCEELMNCFDINKYNLMTLIKAAIIYTLECPKRNLKISTNKLLKILYSLLPKSEYIDAINMIDESEIDDGFFDEVDIKATYDAILNLLDDDFKDKYLDILKDRYVEGFTLEEISDKWFAGKSRETARTTIDMIMFFVREILSTKGVVFLGKNGKPHEINKSNKRIRL